MTDKQQQPEALELASVAESADLVGYPTAKKANAYCLCLLEDCAQMIRRLHAENEALRSGYAAARLETPHGQAPAAVAGPVVNRATVIEWLDANDIEVTDRQMDGLFHFAAPTTQPSPAAQGDALSDDAVRVPLDNLHADAAYLIGRLREGSMPYARAIEIIRERIDAAKAAIRARAAQEGK